MHGSERRSELAVSPQEMPASQQELLELKDGEQKERPYSQVHATELPARQH